MLSLTGNLAGVVASARSEPEHRGHGHPVGEAALILAVFSTSCRDQTGYNRGQLTYTGSVSSLAICLSVGLIVMKMVLKVQIVACLKDGW